jgi:hypothetical protein
MISQPAFASDFICRTVAFVPRVCLGHGLDRDRSRQPRCADIFSFIDEASFSSSLSFISCWCCLYNFTAQNVLVLVEKLVRWSQETKYIGTLAG